MCVCLQLCTCLQDGLPEKWYFPHDSHIPPLSFLPVSQQDCGYSTIKHGSPAIRLKAWQITQPGLRWLGVMAAVAYGKWCHTGSIETHLRSVKKHSCLGELSHWFAKVPQEPSLCPINAPAKKNNSNQRMHNNICGKDQKAKRKWQNGIICRRH